MTTIGAFEAKTHLARLLDRVEDGESFTITKHGRPVAKLVPIGRGDRERRRLAIEALMALRRAQTLGDVTVRELIDEGRE